MPGDHFLDVVCNMYPSNVDRAILPHETTRAAHIISVIRMLVSVKYIHIRVEMIMYTRQSVQILALMTLRTDSACKKEAEIAPIDFVGLRVSSVLHDITSSFRRSLGKVLVFAIASRPLVVPNVEDCAVCQAASGYIRPIGPPYLNFSVSNIATQLQPLRQLQNGRRRDSNTAYDGSPEYGGWRTIYCASYNQQ